MTFGYWSISKRLQHYRPSQSCIHCNPYKLCNINNNYTNAILSAKEQQCHLNGNAEQCQQRPSQFYQNVNQIEYGNGDGRHPTSDCRNSFKQMFSVRSNNKSYRRQRQSKCMLMVVIFYIMIILPITYTEDVSVALSTHIFDNSDNNNNGNDDGKMNNNNPTAQCPSFADNSACPCYKFEDGLFLECPSTTAVSLRSTLQLISSPIQSLSIYDFDRSVTTLSPDLFASGVHIRHLQFSHSHLQTLKENSLVNLRSTLESLSIVNGKLVQIPQKALADMKKLLVVDFDSNEIIDIQDYSFYGLRLIKVNLKGNLLEKITEMAFVGLEETVTEIDLSENRIKTFPILAIKKLEHLRSLRLSLNEIQSIDVNVLSGGGDWNGTRYQFVALTFLDLSSNHFEHITGTTFIAFPHLKTLSLYYNQIEAIDANGFRLLRDIQTIDLSHNRIIHLDQHIFSTNRKLQTIDLGHNHVHYINGVFANLPDLKEVFLSENNILEMPSDSFENSSKISVIYMEQNAIRRCDERSLITLVNLEQLYLSENFIRYIPKGMFRTNKHLTSLSLDGNLLEHLDAGLFDSTDSLREVRLHNNRLETIGNKIFHRLPTLLELHMQNNRIETIETGAFRQLKNLQHINLQGNRLSSLDDIFPLPIDRNINSTLLSIQLDSNNLIQIHNNSFAGQRRVQIMWLGHNRLTKLERSLFKDLTHIERIYLINNSISIIQPETFENMRQLRFLDLSQNKLRIIKSGQFQYLSELEELNLAANEINDIQSKSFNALRKVKTLDLSNNLLTNGLGRDVFHFELPVVALNLANCSLNRLDIGTFSGLNNLNELNLEKNSVRMIDIKQLDVPSLRTLRLSHNNFTQLMDGVFDHLPSLQTLYMDHCNLSQLSDGLFKKNINLVKIDLSYNRLRLLGRMIFNGLMVFKELKLIGNQLSDFPHLALYNISTLETLSLAGNHLTSVDFFKLNGLPYLRHLDLADNNILTLTGFNAVNLTQLDYVGLNGNNLVGLPGNFLQNSITLQRVDLAYNRFQQIPSTALSDTSLPRLGWLNITGNPLTRIYGTSEERYAHLREIHISRTNLTLLTSKDFEAFGSLQHLYLTQNRINRISPGAFISLQNLLTLDISINELELLPKERLQGLKSLQLLNVSHNSVRELEEFSMDLIKLQKLDLSYNQLQRIGKGNFRHLTGLTELFLVGNRITQISADAFKTLRTLKLLDLRRNYFEMIPLRALKILETSIRTLKLEDNPLNCSCDAQELWQWLQDHQKWTRSNQLESHPVDSVVTQPTLTAKSSFPTDDGWTLLLLQQRAGQHLRCEQPSKLRGHIFTEMEPQQFCDDPIIVKLAIQDIQPYSVIVSWQSREYSGLSGYKIVYYPLDEETENAVLIQHLNHLSNSVKLIYLMPSTRYRICVRGTGNWLSSLSPPLFAPLTASNLYNHETSISLSKENSVQTLATTINIDHNREYQSDNSDTFNRMASDSGSIVNLNGLTTTRIDKKEWTDSSITRCTVARTLDASSSLIIGYESGLTTHGLFHSILTRRLGLIVGCCLGIIVFIVLISVLGYLKLKKQRIDSQIKRYHPNGPQLPPDYMSYRQYSIPNDELNRNGPTGGSHEPGGGNYMTTSTVTTPISTQSILHNHHSHHYHHSRMHSHNHNHTNNPGNHLKQQNQQPVSSETQPARSTSPITPNFISGAVLGTTTLST